MKVRILQPCKSAMQAGRAQSRRWIIEPENPTPRMPEPVMGWIGAADPFSGIKGNLFFSSEQAAFAFARNRQWDVEVLEAASRRLRPRNYQDNFRICRPEDEERIAR